MYTYTYVYYVYICVYIYIERERDATDRRKQTLHARSVTAGREEG